MTCVFSNKVCKINDVDDDEDEEHKNETFKICFKW